MPRLFKNKDENSERDASISSIPVPPPDSALVIDLPEGQKLIVGKMEEGTVIEVATWRGTGRPDSRTNRLMLGVSFGGNDQAEQSQEASPQASKLARSMASFRLLSTRVVSGLSGLILSMRKLKNAPSKFDETYTSSSEPLGDANQKSGGQIRSSRSTAVDFDVWLASVLESGPHDRDSAADRKMSTNKGVSSTPKKSSKSVKRVSQGRKTKKIAQRPRKKS
jgi:hypothetical protein